MSNRAWTFAAVMLQSFGIRFLYEGQTILGVILCGVAGAITVGMVKG